MVETKKLCDEVRCCVQYNIISEFHSVARIFNALSFDSYFYRHMILLQYSVCLWLSLYLLCH